MTVVSLYPPTAAATILNVILFALAGTGALAAPSDQPLAPRRDPAAMQAARALVRMGFVGWACPPFYAVDRVKLGEIEGEVFNAAIDRHGKAKLRDAMAAVTPEFKDQLDEGGAALWCPAQRQHFERIGIPGLIGDALP